MSAMIKRLKELPETVPPGPLAVALAISTKTLLRGEKDGLLPRPFRMRRKVLYDREEVIRRLEEQAAAVA